MLPLNRLLLATALLTTACTALAPTKKPSPATAAPKQQGPTWQDIVTRGPQPVDREKRLEAARNEFTRMQAGESRLPVDLHVSTILIALRGMRSDEAKSLWSQVGEARSSAPAAMAPANAGEQEELHSRVFQSILQSANYTLADLSKFDRGAVYNL
ncbi:MAG: hypothetical protein GY811_03950, partial [Myxococcales bacterium]|nr:hypothetical protein [Myxococcales bacterium]